MDQTTNIKPKSRFRNKKFLIGISCVLLTGCLVCAAFIAGLIYASKINSTNDITPTPTLTPTPSVDETTITPTPTPVAIYNGIEKIFFIRLMDRDIASDDELWVSDWNGDNAKTLGIKNVNEVINGPNKKWIIFTKHNEVNRIYALNLSNSSIKTITEEDIPDQAIGYVNGNNSVRISPDENKLVYKVFFLSKSDCGEGGCADYDGYPSRKAGYYSYDLNTNTKKYLGSFDFINNWSTDSTYIFSSSGNNYHEYNYGGKSFRVNINTGEYNLLDTKSSTLGQYNYFNGNKKTSLDMSGSINVLTFYNGTSSIVLETGPFAEVQPMYTQNISYDHKYAVYMKRFEMVGSGSPRYQYMLINLTSGTKSILSKPAAKEDYETPVTWTKDKLLIVPMIKNYDYVNFSNTKLDKDLYYIDVESGVRTQITKFGDIKIM